MLRHQTVQIKTTVQFIKEKGAFLFSDLAKIAFKFLSKKNGKRTISDDKANDTIKVTKVLQFLTEVDPKKPQLER